MTPPEDKDEAELSWIRRFSALTVALPSAVVGGWFLYDWCREPLCKDFSCSTKLMMAGIFLPQAVSGAIKFFRPSETDMPVLAWAHGATAGGIAMAGVQSSSGILFALAAFFSGVSLFYAILSQKSINRA